MEEQLKSCFKDYFEISIFLDDKLRIRILQARIKIFLSCMQTIRLEVREEAKHCFESQALSKESYNM